MNYLAFIAIVAAWCGVLGICGWLAERKKPDTMARYNSRWPTTRGFYG